MRCKGYVQTCFFCVIANRFKFSMPVEVKRNYSNHLEYYFFLFLTRTYIEKVEKQSLLMVLFPLLPEPVTVSQPLSAVELIAVKPQNNCNHGQVFVLSAMSQAVCHALLLFTLSPDLAIVTTVSAGCTVPK